MNWTYNYCCGRHRRRQRRSIKVRCGKANINRDEEKRVGNRLGKANIKSAIDRLNEAFLPVIANQEREMSEWSIVKQKLVDYLKKQTNNTAVFGPITAKLADITETHSRYDTKTICFYFNKDKYVPDEKRIPLGATQRLARIRIDEEHIIGHDIVLELTELDGEKQKLSAEMPPKECITLIENIIDLEHAKEYGRMKEAIDAYIYAASRMEICACGLCVFDNGKWKYKDTNMQVSTKACRQCGTYVMTDNKNNPTTFAPDSYDYGEVHRLAAEQ